MTTRASLSAIQLAENAMLGQDRHFTPIQRVLAQTGILSVGAAFAASLGAVEAAALSSASLIGRITMGVGALFGTLTYAIEQATHPLWEKLYRMETLPSGVKALIRIAETALPRFVALGAWAAIGISFTGWQALALVVANIATPYLAAIGLWLVSLAARLASEILSRVDTITTRGAIRITLISIATGHVAGISDIFGDFVLERTGVANLARALDNQVFSGQDTERDR